MANRRDILRAGLAISAAPVLDSIVSLFSGARPPHEAFPTVAKAFALDGFVFDNRFIESVEAGSSAARHGAKLHEIDGDVTDLWYHHLDLHWRNKPGAFAGVTGGDALFVIENLAWDRRLRVVYRGRHAPPVDGFVEHVFTGPVSLVTATHASTDGGSWTELVGSSIARWLGSRERAKTIELTSAQEGASERRSTLMSWIVAPSCWRMDPV
jgi:hypothetical protein